MLDNNSSATSAWLRPGQRYTNRLTYVPWLILLLLACVMQASAAPADLPPVKKETALEHGRKHLNSKYVCPMHPQIRRDAPGSCPVCGMDLVEKTIEPDKSAYPAITLSADIVQKMGVRTSTVEKGSLAKLIKTVGYVSYNQDRLMTISAPTDGWIENLAVRVKGLYVKKGQLLFEMYSPEFLQAQKDFLVAQKKDQSGINKQYSQRKESVAARDHLRYMKVPDAMMNQIARKGSPLYRLPFYAEQQGTVIRHYVSGRQYVEEDDAIMTIADTTTVWVEVNVYERELDWLRLGLRANIEVKALPGQTYRGEVNFIHPELDPQTHTLRVRLRVPNNDGRLKPNMFAYVKIFAQPKKDILKIPRAALIETGERESVILDRGDGKFQPVDVVTGMRSQDQVEILKGLKQGDSIVVSGQFLIDSEANLQASFNRMDSTE